MNLQFQSESNNPLTPPPPNSNDTQVVMCEIQNDISKYSISSITTVTVSKDELTNSKVNQPPPTKKKKIEEEKLQTFFFNIFNKSRVLQKRQNNNWGIGVSAYLGCKDRSMYSSHQYK